MPRSFRLTLAALAALVSASTSAAQTPAAWHALPGLVIAANMNDATATIIDAANGTVLATLPTGAGPHEVAATHDGRWAVVSNYGPRGAPGNSLTVIDLDTRTVARTIDLGSYTRPHGMKFLPGDTLLAVTSETTRNLLLVSFRDGRVVRTIPTRGRASHMVALSADGADAFTTNIADGTISHIRFASSDSATVIPVAKGIEGITVSPDGSTVWTGSNAEHVVVVVDVARGVATDTIRGFGLPYRLAFTPDGALVVVTDPERAQVRVFDARTHAQRFAIDIPPGALVPTAEVPGSPSPEGVITTPDSRWAFVTLQGRNQLVAIDLVRGEITGVAPTGVWSDGIAFAPRVKR